jgi:DEAD/DEAH box helicase domain-containing protein
MPPAPLPSKIAFHRPLKRKKSSNYRCDGLDEVTRPFSIQRWRALGYEIKTGVFELQLAGLASLEVALPLATAIRDAFATKLGVEAGEMGVSASHTSDENGVRRWSILIFDKAPGGTGFSVAAGDHIDDLLRAAAETLDCPRKAACVRGCPECIMCKDIESLEEKIDRIGALDLARRVVAGLALPAAMAILGPRTRFEFRPLADAVVREMGARPDSELRFWLNRALEGTGLAKWPFEHSLAHASRSPGDRTIACHSRSLS